MSSPIVYFAELPPASSLEERLRATERLLAACGLDNVVAPRDRTAVKIHVGEKHNTTHVAPPLVRAVVAGVKRAGGSPFLTETSTLYKGQRSNAIDHLSHAFAHGFGFEAIGAPFIMADGLTGNSEVEVPIQGLLFDKVAIAREVLLADSLVAVTHATGHLGNGLAAAIKNLGMGLASRMGKLRQHASLKPTVDPQACTFCAKCLKWCPVEAIAERGGKAFIVSEVCIGCGECLAVCRFDAVRHDWGPDVALLQRREAEHALGVIQDKRDKLLVLSYLTDMTKECDCAARDQERLQPDAGILACRDPVAADQAALDLTRERFGSSLAEASWPAVDPNVQLEHGEKIGLGSRTYRLQRVGGVRVNRSKGFRVLIGLAALAAMLVAGFSYLRPWVPAWGSTAEERGRAMPGDDIAAPPLTVSWTHGLTIRAAPEAVWPWIAQLGDDRGGFYSYTFIENFIAREDLYHNANRILPELQAPAPGTGMIEEFLKMREIAPNRHLLAAFEIPQLAMSWIWALYPLDPDRARLVVRMRGRADMEAPGLLMRVGVFFVNYGGFVMERKMMQGIKDRAEGRIEPSWYQGAEIALWLGALGLGLAAAVAYVGRRVWWRGLATGLGAVLVLLLLTFGQPPLWIRLFLLLLLAAGVGWSFRSQPLRRRG